MTAPDHIWKFPPLNMVLPPGEIHVWRAFLDQSETLIAQLALSLSDDEQTRAARFHFARDRRRFIVARGVLRTLLASYTGADPGMLRFAYSPKEKPTLAEPVTTPPLHFNLSHAGELAIYAFTRECEVGIDVEELRPMEDAHQIAEHYFSPRERAILAALPPNDIPPMFFTYWTRKEAYLKACGEGLGFLTTRLDVSQSPVRLPDVNGDYHIQDLSPAPTYIGALAVQAENIHVVYYF